MHPLLTTEKDKIRMHVHFVTVKIFKMKYIAYSYITLAVLF